MKWLINLQFSNELGDVKFIYSNSVADIVLLLRRTEKHTFTRIQQKKEFEAHLTYIEVMEVFVHVCVSEPKHIGRKSKLIDE